MLDLIINIGIMLLLVAAITLCVVTIIVLVKLAPPLLRAARNLDKISTDAASVSRDIADDVAKSARNTFITSEHAVEASANLRKISNDVASVSGDVARDIAETAHNASMASQSTVIATNNFAQLSNEIASISGEATLDIANAAHNASATSDNIAEATHNVMHATRDFAETAANVVAISRLDIRSILRLVSSGNVRTLKDLAGVVAGKLPQAASRVGSVFRRGGG